MTPLILAFFPVFGLAAEPAPAKTPVPSNWVKMTNRAHHFEYFVPPTWTHTPDSDVEIQFQIPVGPNNVFAEGMFVVAARPTQSTTLEDDAAEERKNLSTDIPRHKFTVTKEGKVDFNGRPAWRFEHTDVYDAPVNGGSRGSIKLTTRRLEMLVHDGKTHFYILYQMIATKPDNLYKQFLPQAQQVFDSFKWDDSTDSVGNGPTAKFYHCKKIDVQIELPANWRVEDPAPVKEWYLRRPN